MQRVPGRDPVAVGDGLGVTRQTVYAHFPSREELLRAVLDRLTTEAVTEIDAADIDSGPAAEALFRLVDAGDRTAGRYPVLFRALGAMSLDRTSDDHLHAPVADRLQRTIRRGQEAGEFDAQVSADWLVAATINLGHTAGREVDAGRMSKEEADAALKTSLLRILTPDRSG
ncbi:TetR/AcrR family transcriptional regulator [Saccharomonospora iraqiensis]|uniref:TetR/AcrR family transcriptional regulator n=1 Tax=Saccharomonospora iraqiensis TaxID=52698 RepID=UPI00022E1914|nr:TetR/AcrR family transcriptional regulator [Saccharomonospora iraqiensis]